MVPGFVTMYKDDDCFAHLYFFPGITDEGNRIYKDLVFPHTNIKYKEITYDDNAKEYVFFNKHIIKFTCNLLDASTGEISSVELRT